MQPFLPFSSPQLCQIYFTTLFAENYPPRSSHAKAISPFLSNVMRMSFFIFFNFSFHSRHVTALRPRSNSCTSSSIRNSFFPHASGSSLSISQSLRPSPRWHLQLQSSPSHPTKQLSIAATFSPFPIIFTASPLIHMHATPFILMQVRVSGSVGLSFI